MTDVADPTRSCVARTQVLLMSDSSDAALLCPMRMSYFAHSRRSEMSCKIPANCCLFGDDKVTTCRRVQVVAPYQVYLAPSLSLPFETHVQLPMLHVALETLPSLLTGKPYLSLPIDRVPGVVFRFGIVS